MQTISALNIPAAPTLPESAPVLFEMWDHSVSPALMTSSIRLDQRGPDYISEDAVYAEERGAAAWYRSDQVLTLGEFTAGAHLLVSHAGNTKSGTKPLEEVLIAFGKNSPTWKGYPSAEFYDKKNENVFMPAFKIVAKNAAGEVVHIFQMRDGLPINDPSLHSQGFPTAEKALRPKLSCFNFLPWQNERPRRSASLSHMFPGIIDEAMRPSTAKTHYSVLSCEPLVTGGYNRWSLNSLANIWAAPQFPMPKGGHWGVYAKKDPYFNYADTGMDGRSAFMGPYVMGYDYEPGSFSTHNHYTGPGGPRFDRSPWPSQVALFATDPNWKRVDGDIAGEDMAYGYSLAYANHHNKQVSNPATLFWKDDANVLSGKEAYIGNYYGDGARRGPNTIEINASQRDGTNDSHIDKNGNMPFGGWGRDTLHNYTNAAVAAMTFQSPMFAIMSKWDTTTAFMMHGPADRNIGESFGVRDYAWEVLQHAFAWKVAANHPLSFARKDIEDRLALKFERTWREIGAPCMNPNRDPSNLYLEGIARFGQPILKSGDNRFFMAGGGLGFYIAGALANMKQSGLWAALQARGGDCKLGVDFTLHSYCQYAFGLFGVAKATIFSNVYWSQDEVCADGSNIPKDWAEMSAKLEGHGEAFNIDANGNTMWGDRDASVHPLIQFILVMEDYFPEVEHKWKAAAVTNTKMYLQRTTDLVNSLAGDPGRQRDADHRYRVPGVAPLKKPAVLGPSPAITLPTVPVMDTSIKPIIVNDEKLGVGEWVLIAKENGKAVVGANTTVRYGAGNNWFMKEVNGEVVASNDVFGDPIKGVVKVLQKFVPVEPVVVPPVVEEPPVVVTPEVTEPPVVIDPPTPTPPSQGASVAQAMVAAAIAFLESLGYKVTK